MRQIFCISLVLLVLTLSVSSVADQKLRVNSEQSQTQKHKITVRAPGSESIAIPLPGGLAIDVTVEFDSVNNLSLPNLGLSASVVNPVDVALLARLPDSLVSIPDTFPVVVVIEPPSVGLNLLNFDGIVIVTLLTSNLPYYPDTKLRLFKAHDGGDFEDVTHEVSKGSYRVRGSGGDFSEFLIAYDGRDNNDAVNTKFASLQSTLSGYVGDIDSTVYATLTSLLDDAELHWEKPAISESRALINSFIAAVLAATPSDLPNSWAADGGPDNIAGILHAKALSLEYSLHNGESKSKSR